MPPQQQSECNGTSWCCCSPCRAKREAIYAAIARRVREDRPKPQHNDDARALCEGYAADLD